MSVYRIAVCDDVAIERSILCVLLHECNDEQIIYQFESGEELLRSQETFDIAFLDIFMNGMTGMDTARALQKRGVDTPIVFLTASPYFAVESYEINAFDYIVKPLQPERLKLVWDRFLKEYKKNQRYFVINYPGKTAKLAFDQIEFIESDRHYISVNLADGTTLRFQGKLDSIEEQFNDPRFLRCHQSFLINMGLADAMDDDFLMHSGKRVAYRKRDKKTLQRIFYDFMMKEAY